VHQDKSSVENEPLNHLDSKSQVTVNTASKVITKAAVKTKPQSMSVSRRQLSAEELAQQKLVRAEKALAAKNISKAEKLLEDVMIITPNDSQARKKLAALWFGRQAYQDAVNLLSQGITLNGKDSSLRQMKARIHLTQGQATAALNTLKPLANLKDEQYQIMLANTAQQAQHSKAAINAYTMLIAMQPDMGRWQLGIAVLYDKNSQFNLAIDAYNKALAKNDLSVSSEKFVKERIQAIGQ
jgi:MSHA biogenesis protein MshN